MYDCLKGKFKARFNRDAKWIFSAPGRTELGGNHTDHQNGIVLAAAVNLDSKAAVAPNGENIIRVFSETYPMCEISLPPESACRQEFGSTYAIIKGIAAGFSRLGCQVQGFDAYVCSDVLPGSGLSSSAAFEVLMGVIINHMGGFGLSPAEIAKIGKYAENVYFGKPCGLMDQMASSVGNIIEIDFKDPDSPSIQAVDFDFSSCGHALCIIDSGASHADLTDCYAAIPQELKKVCEFFGRDVLREIPENEFYGSIADLRKTVGDRAVLRAIHVYEENKRVKAQAQALKAGNFDEFLRLVKESGKSSWQLLQNVIPEGRTDKQEMAFALAVSERLLNGKGAVRVHGGGFAGTVQAFVPNDMLSNFRDGIEKVLGKGSCHVLYVWPFGGALLEEC